MEHEPNTNTLKVLIFIWGFVLAVFVSSFYFISPLISIFIIFIAITVLIAEKIYKQEISKEVIFISLALISFGLGTLRYDIKDFHEEIIPTNIGVVISEPEQKENTTRFVVRSENNEKVLVSTDLYSEVKYGDRVNIEGKLQKPAVIESETGRPFDYAAYLAKDDIYFTMSFAKVEVISHGHGNFIKSFLFGIRRSVISKIQEILPEPNSSLLAGLLLAGKSAMPKDILEEFRRAGIIHVVVLSGFNITIISDFLKKWLGSSAGVIGIISFVLMTGAEATVVRAAIMVLLVVFAKNLRRPYSAPRALFSAGFIMLIHNPKILVFDPSFQLSFLATAALIYIVPIFEKLLEKVPEKWQMKSALITTISTQVAVLPLLIYSMGDVSLVSLPANLLVFFVIPLVMLTGFLATLVGYVSSILAIPLAFVSQIMLSWIIGVANTLGNLSFATVATGPLSAWFVLLIYLAIIILAWRSKSYFPQSPNSS